jgi:geranylgeranyl reductase family protein
MNYDVIVIGAGPAGSTCARECAKRGLRTLLLDRMSFPRPKPCGGALSAQALARLDFSLPPEIIEQECFAVRVRYGSRAVEVRRDQRICAMVSRDRFDSFLADKAVEQGVEFRQGEQVIGVIDGPQTVEVRTANSAYQGRYVVAADGANSITARTIRPTFSRNEIMTALVASVAGDAGKTSDVLELFFGIAPRGYGWVFPHKDYKSVGVMGLASEFSGAQKCLAEFARSQNLILTETKGQAIPFSGIARPLTAQRILLAGDAAGFADPFHGEGIGNAMFSGILAARAIAEHGPDPKACASWYERKCEELLVRDLRVALRLSLLLERFPGFFLTLFFTHKKTLERYIDIALGDSDYSRFQRWVLVRLPLFLASHAVRKLFRPGQAAGE